MMKNGRTMIAKGGTAAAIALAAVLLWGGQASAHCDTVDGPVVSDARAALEKGDPAAILKWVKSDMEHEISEAFESAVAVRKLGPEAKAMADNYFFETLVRAHRAGEGAPYTGLKAAGSVAPPIAAADRALESGEIDGLVSRAQSEVAEGIRSRFERAVEAAKHKNESVEAGREFVEAYVIYVHYLEGLHATIEGGAAHHEESASSEHEQPAPASSAHKH